MNDLAYRTLPVFIGGALGALARYGIQELAALIWPEPSVSEPVSLFVINLLGCFVIGAITVHHVNKKTHPNRHAFLATGVLGGFTSFSSYIVLIDRLEAESSLLAGAAYLALTLVACVLGAGLGQGAGKWERNRRQSERPGHPTPTPAEPAAPDGPHNNPRRNDSQPGSPQRNLREPVNGGEA